MKTVPQNPSVKRKPILFHWHWILAGFCCAATIDILNHLLGNY